MDILKVFGPENWQRILEKIHKDGWPTDESLATALRGNQPIPQEMRDYIADRLDGTIKRKRGRQKDDSLIAAVKIFRRGMVRDDVIAEVERLKDANPGKEDFTQQAIYNVARRHVDPDDILEELEDPSEMEKKIELQKNRIDKLFYLIGKEK